MMFYPFERLRLQDLLRAVPNFLKEDKFQMEAHISQDGSSDVTIHTQRAGATLIRAQRAGVQSERSERVAYFYDLEN